MVQEVIILPIKVQEVHRLEILLDTLAILHKVQPIHLQTVLEDLVLVDLVHILHPVMAVPVEADGMEVKAPIQMDLVMMIMAEAADQVIFILLLLLLVIHRDVF